MRVTTVFLAAAAAACAFAAAAEKQRECIDAKMIDGLVFQGRSDLKTDVHPGAGSFMQGLKLPPELFLIGSGVRDGGITTVAYKTSLPSEKAQSAVVTSLQQQGWETENVPGRNPFSVPGSPSEETLCRNAERRRIAVKDAGGTRYVMVVAVTTEQAGGRKCHEDVPVPENTIAAQAVMPRFQLPAGSRSAAAGGFSGGGSGGASNGTSSMRVATADPQVLIEYLGRQLDEQGWRHDAAWRGGASSGSTWIRMDDGKSSRGTLEVVRVGEDSYNVNFSVTTRN